MLTGSVDGEKNDNTKSNNNRFSICFIHELTIEKAKENAQTIMPVRFLLTVFPNISFASLVPQSHPLVIHKDLHINCTLYK